MGQEISIENVGPIEQFSFKLEGYGVTVLSAPNGTGKSILLNTMQHAALGSGKLPLRDGARRGSVEAFGALISIGATTRYKGEFQITNLESRLPLSMLVDPKMKSPEASDRQRIKALVALTGVKATRDLFTSNELFHDFGLVVSDESTATDDLVEMASRVKRDYEAKAREAEKEADREDGHARGLEEASEHVDMSAESDSAQLTQEYDAARDVVTKLDSAMEASANARKGRVEAHEKLRVLKESYVGKSAEDAAHDYADVYGRFELQQKRCDELRNQILQLSEQLEREEEKCEKIERETETARSERQRAFDHNQAMRALEDTITELTNVPPVEDDVYNAAAKRLQDAADARDRGAIIRDARQKIAQAEVHKQRAKLARDAAERMRVAARSVDEVLSDAIQCDRLKVEIWEGQPRLVVEHPVRGPHTPYGELSEGERWKLAIDLGVDRVGEGGLLVIPQDAWESVDAFNRQVIHDHAVERKVHILTAEATRDPAEGRELKAKQFAMEA